MIRGSDRIKLTMMAAPEVVDVFPGDDEDKFVEILNKKLRQLKRRFKIVYETDPELRDLLCQKIELINMLIVAYDVPK